MDGVHRDTQLANIPLQGLNRHNYTDSGSNIRSLLADLEPSIDTISPVWLYMVGEKQTRKIYQLILTRGGSEHT